MWQRIFPAIIIALALCTHLHAAPALPEFVDLQQPDGSTVKARQQGDEFQHWTETRGGYTLLRNPQTKYWDYADKEKNGRLKASGYRVQPQGLPPAHIAPRLKPPRNLELEKYQQQALKAADQKRRQVPAAAAFSSPLAAPSAGVGAWSPVPVSGERKLLLVLVNFTDRALLTSAAAWEDPVFSPEKKSLLRYYAENSFSALAITPAPHTQAGSPEGVITVTIAALHPNGDESYPTEARILNLALAQASAAINFSTFDTDRNGNLEPSELMVYFIFAGFEGSGSNLTPSVWAHAWGGDGVTAGGKNLNSWAINGELNNFGRQQPMGVIAHELGHALGGLPDLYDTSNSNAGMGIFSLMASGSWGAESSEDAGTTPTALDLWSREYCGWSTPAPPAAASALTVSPALARADSGYKLLAPASSSEYFLLENRQPQGWDLGIRHALGAGWQGGLLLTHIDNTAGTAGANDINNFLASGGRQGVLPVQAQASLSGCDMILSDCQGAATTLFSAANNSSWTPLTAPDSNYYDGAPTNFSLTAISPPAEEMTAAWSTSPVPTLTIVEDFASGNLSKLPWLTSGNGSWTVTSFQEQNGLVAKAPAINDSQSATLQTTVESGSGKISFRFSIDSERSFDFLIFAIDGREEGRWSGSMNWSRAVYPLTAGSHTLSWTYQKDENTAAGADSAWIDDLTFPARIATGVTLTSNLASPQGSATPVTFSASANGGDAGPYEYRFWWRPAEAGASWRLAQAYSPTPFWVWDPARLGLAAGSYFLQADTRHVGNSARSEAVKSRNYRLYLPATSVALNTSPVSPRPVASLITLSAVAQGGDAGPYEYRFWWRPAALGSPWTVGQSYSSRATWEWRPFALGLPPGSYYLQVDARHPGNFARSEALKTMTYRLQ